MDREVIEQKLELLRRCLQRIEAGPRFRAKRTGVKPAAVIWRA